MPRSKINIKIKTVKVNGLEGVWKITKGVGIRSTISISKIKKITASKKKRVEKGNRALSFGSKPHSNGVLFSRSLKVRMLKE